jgi:tryptophanyl-tRNA synthetase
MDKQTKKRVFSGIQPTGDIHIGNYLGAIQNWVSLLDRYECIYCIVDYHAMTIAYEVEQMARNIRNALLDSISLGLDPEKCILFLQSDVPEVTELTWILNTVTPMGDLSRMTQFKEKSVRNQENVNAGLFTYPVLQTADIILYKASHVPVGEDQVQHIELAREIVRDYNRRFGNVFPEPQALLTEARRIMGLDGTSKMSKSLNNYISLNETKESLQRKIMGAVTDEDRKRRHDPGNPDICNVMRWHEFFPGKDDLTAIDTGCRDASIGCVEHKRMVIERMWEFLDTFQQHRAKLANQDGYVEDVLAAGAQKARKIAGDVIAEVRQACGLRPKPI